MLSFHYWRRMESLVISWQLFGKWKVWNEWKVWKVWKWWLWVNGGKRPVATTAPWIYANKKAFGLNGCTFNENGYSEFIQVMWSKGRWNGWRDGAGPSKLLRPGSLEKVNIAEIKFLDLCILLQNVEKPYPQFKRNPIKLLRILTWIKPNLQVLQ